MCPFNEILFFPSFYGDFQFDDWKDFIKTKSTKGWHASQFEIQKIGLFIPAVHSDPNGRFETFILLKDITLLKTSLTLTFILISYEYDEFFLTGPNNQLKLKLKLEHVLGLRFGIAMPASELKNNGS